MKKSNFVVFVIVVCCFQLSTAFASVGDVDGNGTIGLNDAILAIQVCVDNPVTGVNTNADVNKDGKIGVEEALYVLNVVAGRHFFIDCSYLADVDITTDMNTATDSEIVAAWYQDSTVYSYTQPSNGVSKDFIIGHEFIALMYTPNNNFHGSDSFTFTVDGCTKNFTVQVNGPTIVIPFADQDHGVEPWVTDGTEAGTHMISDVNAGTGSSMDLQVEDEIYKLNNSYYFNFWYVPPGLNRWEGYGMLYKITKDNVYSVKDHINIADFTSLNNILYFSGQTDPFVESDGRLLWKSDGTTSGTNPVKDMVPGTNSDQIDMDIVSFEGCIFYSAVYYDENQNEKHTIWKSDGTQSGTNEFLDVTDFSFWGGVSLAVAGNFLFFEGKDQNHDGSLWISDGTTAGTRSLKTIRTDGNSADIRYITGVNGTVFFTATDGTGNNNHDLWKTDGTTAGTVKVKVSAYSSIGSLTACGNRLYFSINHSLNISDGTEAGTHELTEFNTDVMGSDIYIEQMFCINNILYIKTYNETSDGYSLYSLNPTVSNVPITINGTANADLSIIPYPLEDSLIYSTDDGNNYKLWKYNPTEGNVLVKSNVK
ncbi:MAG: hypothetical protein GXP53_07270 [Deltaproteobacteria bacterium]|nr:hypothetical protein [Deltaproteobacteria bacterium]